MSSAAALLSERPDTGQGRLARRLTLDRHVSRVHAGKQSSRFAAVRVNSARCKVTICAYYGEERQLWVP
jgi:hypothetical protein